MITKIKNFTKEIVFGVSLKGDLPKIPSFRTVMPAKQPKYNDWVKKVNFGSNYQEGIFDITIPS